VALVALVATVGALGLGGGGNPSGPAVPRSGTTVRVTRQTLTQTGTVDGSLGYGPEIPVAVKTTGTLTWLPAAGSTVGRGGVLMRIDDRPVTLMLGDLPMYRRLSDTPAESATGHDVKQFETNLAALGYTGFTVDDTYTAQTVQAVKRWQKDLGLPQTGAVEVGDVYYAAGLVRIARGLLRVGAATGGDVLTYTGTGRVVTVNAPVSALGWATAGAAVDIVLPDGKAVPATVTSVSSTATAPPAGDAGGGSPPPTVPVVVTATDPAALGQLDSAPVSVRYVIQQRENVLAVPVAALVALAEGGFGLEEVQNGGSHFVAVETGLFADGMVEVRGADLAEGATVRVPE
jgi:peptidoglycan hydrolase-like protein with peptidoglycan-binding domain